jgi:hypothetical protein
MENVKILIDGLEKDVYGIFYIYDSKYYFIYTEKELDESGYVILYMCQVGKETQNTPTGPIDTGYMLGMEITDTAEQQKVQTSVSYIVEDKKNNTLNPQIQYLPINMLTNLKIISKKRFRLLKSIIIDNFKLNFEESIEISNVVNNQPVNLPVETSNNNETAPTTNEVNVIIDYRTRFFEEEEKNKELQAQIDSLTQKLNEIKNILE